MQGAAARSRTVAACAISETHSKFWSSSAPRQTCRTYGPCGRLEWSAGRARIALVLVYDRSQPLIAKLVVHCVPQPSERMNAVTNASMSANPGGTAPLTSNVSAAQAKRWRSSGLLAY